MMKEFATPEIKEIKLVTDNRADECIKVPVCRFQELLDAETRLDAIVDIIKAKFGKYTTDAEKDVLIIAGHASYVDAYEAKKKEQ